MELRWVVADDEHAVAVYRAQGERDGGRWLDIEQALLIDMNEGTWADIRAQPLDQAAFDAFWLRLGLAQFWASNRASTWRRRSRRASQIRKPSTMNGPAITRK